MSTKKVSNLLSNIFTRKRSSNLETDAVPVSDNGLSTEQQNCDNQENTTANNSFETSDNNNSSIINNDIQNFDTISSSSSIINTNNLSDEEIASSAIATTTNNINNLDVSTLNQMNMITPNNNNTNNSLAVNNTHGHVIYQFSNIDGLHIGHVINVQNGTDSKTIPINGNKSSSNKYQERLKPKTPTIQKMMESKELLDHKMIDVISKYLGEGWKDIMRKLNYSEGEIHQTYIYYKDEGLKEVIYQLLLDWSRNDDNATLGEITTILWKAGQRDVVYDMKYSFKKYNSSFCNSDKKNKNNSSYKIENESEI